MLRNNKYRLLAGLLFLPLGGAFAQDPMTVAASSSAERDVFLLLIYTAIIVGVICLLLLSTLFVLILKDYVKKSPSVEGAEAKPSFWKRFNRSMTAAVPIEQESDIVLDHNYDGIRELDNRLPPWWVAGFYLTIVFGVIYMWYYHASSAAWSSEKQYNTEIAEAEAEVKAYLATAANLVDENTVTYLTDAASLEAGKSVYDEKNCAQCHLADGGGLIGPNFTDEYFIHGGKIENIFSTIKYGVVEKGMISWSDQLSPLQMQQVASYVKSLVGTTPAEPKAPEGDRYVEEAEESETVEADSAKTIALIP